MEHQLVGFSLFVSTGHRQNHYMDVLRPVRNLEDARIGDIGTERVISSRKLAAVDGEVERNGCPDCIVLRYGFPGRDESCCDEESDCCDVFHDDSPF